VLFRSLQNSDLPLDKMCRVITLATLQIADAEGNVVPDAYAAGDCAAVPDLYNPGSFFPSSNGYDPGLVPHMDTEFIGSAIRHSILPAFTILISTMSGWILGQRNMMVSVASEDYITVAHAKGLKDRRVMLGYAARNALLPNVSGFALSLGFIVGGTLLVEIVFSYPGVGYQLFQAVGSKDYPLLQGIFLIITLTVLAANFVADIVYVALDPRTRREA